VEVILLRGAEEDLWSAWERYEEIQRKGRGDRRGRKRLSRLYSADQEPSGERAPSISSRIRDKAEKLLLPVAGGVSILP
jgi:hypothetical protein